MYGLPMNNPRDAYSNAIPPAHRHVITLQNHTSSSAVPLPAQGIIAWHYIQCVMHFFGTEQLRQQSDIFYYELPFKTDDDDDDEFDWDYYNQAGVAPPWPGYHLGPHPVNPPPAAVSEENISNWANSVHASVSRTLSIVPLSSRLIS